MSFSWRAHGVPIPSPCVNDSQIYISNRRPFLILFGFPDIFLKYTLVVTPLIFVFGRPLFTFFFLSHRGPHCDRWWLHWTWIRELIHLIERAILSWLFPYFSLLSFIFSLSSRSLSFHSTTVLFMVSLDLVSFILDFTYACIYHLLCYYFFVSFYHFRSYK